MPNKAWEETIITFVRDACRVENRSKSKMRELVNSLLKEQREEILKIITKEIALTHSGKRGKTSGLTSLYVKLTNGRNKKNLNSSLH